MDKFTRAYIEAALWSSTDNSDESGGRPLDFNYGVEDIAPETIASILDDCKAFQEAHANDIGDNLEQAGHDFWLTRNHTALDSGTVIGPIMLVKDLLKQAMPLAMLICTLAMTA